jgi:hypothetical protein
MPRGVTVFLPCLLSIFTAAFQAPISSAKTMSSTSRVLEASHQFAPEAVGT